MLVAVLVSFVLGLVPSPQAPVAVAAAGFGGSVDAVAVAGTTELSAAESFAAARAAAIEHLRARWTERGERHLVDQRPFWLPEFLARQAVSRWLSRQSAESALRIVDRQDRVRDHEFGQSFQTTLWIGEDPRAVARGEGELRRELRVLQKRTLVTAAGTVGFWAVLGVVLSWLDRLSRGYMTGRLRLVGLLLGALVPPLAFLL